MRTPIEELQQLEKVSLRRQLRTIDAIDGVKILQNGSWYTNFGSNDYLGLSQHSLVKEAFERGVQEWGAGAGASRLVTGSLGAHAQLETWLAEAKGSEAALSFANGYSTALGVVSALAGKGDVVILDKLCHASLIDGARLSGAKIRVFGHNRIDQLEAILGQVASKNHAAQRVLVITESVFSMDGDHARLEDIVALKKRYEFVLMVDEAHGVGVLGQKGLGLVEQLGLSESVDIQMGTLGKAAGVAGGYVCATRDYIDWLTNRARSLIYSSAPPPAQALAALTALRLISSEAGAQRREALWKNIACFKNHAQLDEMPSSAIIPWHVGESARALELQDELKKAGFFCPAIRYPTVPRNTARLRITITSQHKEEEIKIFAKKLLALRAEDRCED